MVGDNAYEQGTGSLIFPTTEFIVDANIADIGVYSQGGDLRLSDIVLNLSGSPYDRTLLIPEEEHLNSAIYSVGSEDYDTIFKADDIFIENNYLEENPDVVTDQVYNGIVTVDHDNVWLSNSEIKGDMWDGVFAIQSDRVLLEDTDILRSDESAMLMGCAVATSKYDKYLEQEGWPTDLSVIDSEIANYQKGIGAFSDGEGQKMTLHNVDIDVYDEVPMLWVFFNWGWSDTEETVVSNVNIKQEEESEITQGTWIFGWGGDIALLNSDVTYVTDENIEVPKALKALIAEDLAEELRISKRASGSSQVYKEFLEQSENTEAEEGFPNYNFITFHIPEENQDSPFNRLVINVRNIDDITAEKFGNLRNPENPDEALKGVTFVNLITGKQIENPFQNVEEE
ncbi:hypothetical protein GF362_05915 [Candidatus Dojkabacteria bacterium]|nr:hypothetical protein [Candidatus Dojkabacteria bacterium]